MINLIFKKCFIFAYSVKIHLTASSLSPEFKGQMMVVLFPPLCPQQIKTPPKLGVFNYERPKVGYKKKIFLLGASKPFQV